MSSDPTLYRLIDPFPDDCPTYIRETEHVYHEGFIELVEPVGTLTVTEDILIPGMRAGMLHDTDDATGHPFSTFLPPGRYLIVP